jgi:hypothetical protein
MDQSILTEIILSNPENDESRSKTPSSQLKAGTKTHAFNQALS